MTNKVTKIQSDKNGFILGTGKKDWQTATKEWHEIHRDVSMIRTMLERERRSGARHDTTQRTAEATGRAVGAVVLRHLQAQAAVVPAARRRAVAVAKHMPHPMPARGANGRFVGAGGAPLPGLHPKQPIPPKHPLSDDDKDDRKKHGKELAEAARALAEAGDIAAHVDPAAAAAKEVKEVITPLTRGFTRLFGRSEEQKKQAWYKKIYSRLGDMLRAAREGAALRVPVSGGGVKGWLGRGLLSMTSAAGIGGMIRGAGSRLIGAPLEGFAAARNFLGGRLAPLAALFDIGSGYRADSQIRNDASLTAGQRSDRRLTNLATTGARLGGHLGGAAAGAALGGAVGTIVPVIGNAIGAVVGGILGAAFGPAFVQRLSNWMSPIIGDGVDFIRSTAHRVSDLFDSASQLVTAAAKTLLDSKPVQTVRNGYEATVDAAANGIDNTVHFTKKAFNAVGQALGFAGGANINGLSDAQTRAYAANVAGTESSGNQRSVNRFGYLGQYQFGADALADQGLVDKGKLAAAKKAAGGAWYSGGFHKAFLDDPNNWTGLGGKSAFLVDKGLQDRTFLAYTNANIAAGMRSGALSANSSPAQIAAYAKAAHLKGSRAADNLFLRHIDSSDAFGTSASSYAGQAAAAVSAISDASDVPSIQPPSMPAIPDAPRIARQANSGGSSGSAPPIVPAQDVGQNLRDRTIGHAATGGIGAG